MQKTTLAFMSAISLLLTLSACQPKSEESTTAPIKTDELQKTPPPIRIAEPKGIQDKTVDAKICLALNQTMQKVDGDSKIEAIHTIQEQLKSCLPTANNTEVMTLLKNYQAMYDRFLASNLDSESDYETFNNAIYELSYEGLSPAQLKTLSPRNQYLVGLVKSDADVSIYDEGEGYFSFTHNLEAMADIFISLLR